MRGRWRIGVVALVATVANVTVATNTTAEPSRLVPDVVDLTSQGLPAAPGSIDQLVAHDLAPQAATAGATFAGFNTISPQRVLDTRAGAPVGPDQFIVLHLAGVGAVPADAGAVVMNVTATSPSLGGYVTVWPSGTPRPDTSSLNMAAGQTVANLVVVKLGADGSVGLYNNAGTTHLLGDVVAWARADGHFVGLPPARVLDTRASAPLAPGASIDVAVRGVGGVPATGAGTVVVNITATRPTSPTYLTVWPSGAPRPNASSLNVALDQTVPNLVFAQIGSNGKISIFNERGNTDVLADVVGYIADGAAYVALNPVRVMDTRNGFGTYGVLQSDLGLNKVFGRLGANQTFTLDLDNQLATSLDGVSLSSVAGFVFNVTAVDPTSPGYLTVFPGALPRPGVSNINVTAGAIVPNAVVVKPGPLNLVSIYNETGTVHVIVDLVGYIPLQNVVDALDASGAFKFHVLYVQGSDSNPADQPGALAAIRSEVTTLDGWFSQPAQAGRHLNLDQAAGQIEITTIRYEQFTKARLVNWSIEAGFPVLRQLSDDGFGNGQSRRWLVYFDGDRTALLPGESSDPDRAHVCGIRYYQFTTVFMKNGCHDVDGSANVGNFASQSNAGLVALHEMLHGLGAVSSCAPHYTSFGGGHVGGINGVFINDGAWIDANPDKNDLMFPYAGYLPKSLDIGRDDYYGHNNPGCLDLQDSPFIAPA